MQGGVILKVNFKKSLTVATILSVLIFSITTGGPYIKNILIKSAKIALFVTYPETISGQIISHNIDKKTTEYDTSSFNESSSDTQSAVIESSWETPKIETGKIETLLLTLNTANTNDCGIHISNKTGLDINIPELLKQGLPFEITDINEPQVLIVHTHATESYTNGDYGYYIKGQDTRTTDNSKNVVRAGDVLADVLNKAGLVTINDKTQHDYPSYTGGYARSAETIKTYLKKYPTIKVVIDLHRDAITQSDNTKIKPTAEINGKKAAQIMLLCGAEVGDVTDFPNWKENLRFNLALEKQLEADYPDICRPMSFKQCVYNFDIINGSILIELGSEANTLEEALYSAELLGNSLVKVLKK